MKCAKCEKDSRPGMTCCDECAEKSRKYTLAYRDRVGKEEIKRRAHQSYERNKERLRKLRKDRYAKDREYVNAQNNEYYRKHREEHLERSKRNYMDHRENRIVSAMKRRYGIGLDVFSKMMVDQQNRCACCGKKEKLNIDHDHKSGAIRGLLCRSCNIAAGMIKDNPKTAEALARYLRKARNKQAQPALSLVAPPLSGHRVVVAYGHEDAVRKIEEAAKWT